MSCPVCACRGWPRVPVTVAPCRPGLGDDETELALLSMCTAYWSRRIIPVVAWGTPNDGTELHPPVYH